MVVKEVVVTTVVAVHQSLGLVVVVTTVVVVHQYIGLVAGEVVVMVVAAAHHHRLDSQMMEVLAMGAGTPGALQHLEGGLREGREETNQRSFRVIGTSLRLFSSNLVVNCK